MIAITVNQVGGRTLRFFLSEEVEEEEAGESEGKEEKTRKKEKFSLLCCRGHCEHRSPSCHL